MIPADFDGANMTWRAPDGLEAEVSPLRVRRTECPEHGTYLTSVWRPTEEELDVLRAGGFVLLSVYGSVHPVVALTARMPENLPGAKS